MLPETSRDRIELEAKRQSTASRTLVVAVHGRQPPNGMRLLRYS